MTAYLYFSPPFLPTGHPPSASRHPAGRQPSRQGHRAPPLPLYRFLRPRLCPRAEECLRGEEGRFPNGPGLLLHWMSGKQLYVILIIMKRLISIKKPSSP